MSDTLSEEQLSALVQRFYDQARAHPALAALFGATVSDWDHHLKLVHDFWSHALLGTQRYKGHPYPVHQNIGIQREHFEVWLSLFRAAAAETLPPPHAAAAVARAEHMARAFKAGLFPFDPA